jgi:hypothetical protein
MELRRNARFRPAVHKLKIDPNVQPVKQAPRRMRIELEEKGIWLLQSKGKTHPQVRQ